MTRIIAGPLGGRTLRTPPGSGTRPTSDRVREALFSALDARGAVAGARVLDLYAGSGALGVDAALARAAGEPEQVDLVFIDPPYDVDEDALGAVLARLASGWLGPEALVVVERSKRSPEPTWPDGLERDGKPRKYGETTIWLARPAT